jgi:hypothetical protein
MKYKKRNNKNDNPPQAMLNVQCSYRQLELLVRRTIWLRPILVLQKLLYLLLPVIRITMSLRIMTEATLVP